MGKNLLFFITNYKNLINLYCPICVQSVSNLSISVLYLAILGCVMITICQHSGFQFKMKESEGYVCDTCLDWVICWKLTTNWNGCIYWLTIRAVDFFLHPIFSRAMDSNMLDKQVFGSVFLSYTQIIFHFLFYPKVVSNNLINIRSSYFIDKVV